MAIPVKKLYVSWGNPPVGPVEVRPDFVEIGDDMMADWREPRSHHVGVEQQRTK